MTAAGSNEMLETVRAAAGDAAVRAIVITGGLPDIFIRHYDVGELSVPPDDLAGRVARRPSRHPHSRRPPAPAASSASST